MRVRCFLLLLILATLPAISVASVPQKPKTQHRVSDKGDVLRWEEGHEPVTEGQPKAEDVLARTERKLSVVHSPEQEETEGEPEPWEEETPQKSPETPQKSPGTPQKSPETPQKTLKAPGATIDERKASFRRRRLEGLAQSGRMCKNLIVWNDRASREDAEKMCSELNTQKEICTIDHWEEKGKAGPVKQGTLLAAGRVVNKIRHDYIRILQVLQVRNCWNENVEL